MEHIANYFNLLVNYIQRNEGKDSMQVYLVSITRIRDELNRWIKTYR